MRRRSQKNRVRVWRRNKKSRYIGEEWIHVWRRKNKKEKRKRKEDIEGHACIDSSKLFENSTFCCEQKFPDYFLP